MLDPVGLIRGHYECRSFKDTLPILTEILALEIVGDKNGDKIVKHPNTDWRIVVHESGPETPNKPMRNHYGVRVATNDEVDRACEYLEKNKEQFRIKVIKPRENHNAYSVHFFEPGGNYWEIESYEKAVETGIGKTTNPHWIATVPEGKFPGRGYVPQALTHGTVENDDLEASGRFYREVLGLEVVKLWPTSQYLKHPSTPWYIVCLQALKQNRQPVGPYQRFTLTLGSRDKVSQAHELFQAHRDDWQITNLEAIRETADEPSFLFSDLNRNWWEITSALQ